jgi:male germ cell-associated kinase
MVFNSYVLFIQCEGIHLSEVITSASQDAINLISVSIAFSSPYSLLNMTISNITDNANYYVQWLCSWDPRRRPTAVEVLQHPFFQVVYLVYFCTAIDDEKQ